MNPFETELVRAIEHGCPFCGGEWLELYCIEERGYTLGTDGSSVTYDEHGAFQSSINKELLCRCSATLWTAEHGWIPELQEIVRGE